MRSDLRYIVNIDNIEQNKAITAFRPTNFGVPTHDDFGKSINNNKQQIFIQKNTLFQKVQSNQFLYSKHSNYLSSSSLKNNQLKQKQHDFCESCKSLKLQKQTIVKFMKEQIQIASKQYKEKMNKILKQQAKQVIQLKGKLQKNQQIIVQLMQKFSQNKSNFINENTDNLDYSYYQNRQKNKQKIQKVSPLRIEKKSPSKLSLTKSTFSLSQKPKSSKISMLSKELSPAKIVKMNSQSQNINKSGASISMNTTNISINLNQMVKKIKQVQQKLALSFEYQNQRTQKFHLFNKHLQMIESGLVKLFAFKIKNSEETLSKFMFFQQNKIKMIQEDLIKCIRLAKLNCNLKTDPFQNKMALQKINQNDDKNMTKNNLNPQAKVFINNLRLQVEQLKQICKQMKTKQFKYDNFQVQELVKFYNEINQKVNFLNKQKQKMRERLSSLIFQQEKSKVQKNKSDKSVGKKTKFQQNCNSVYGSKSQSLKASHNQFQKQNNRRKQILALAVQQNLQQLSKTTSLCSERRINKEKQIKYQKVQNLTFFQNEFPDKNNQNSNLFDINKFLNISYNPIDHSTQFRQQLKSCQKQLQQNQYPKIFNLNYSHSHSIFSNPNQSNSHIQLSTKSLFTKFKQSKYNQQLQNIKSQQSILSNFHQNVQHFESQQQQFQSQKQNINDNQNNYQNYDDEDDEFFYPDYQNQHFNIQNQSIISQHKINKSKNNIERFMDIFNYRKYQNSNQNSIQNINLSSSNDYGYNISNFNQYHNIRPIHVQIDQTGYIKCSENGMYIVDRNGDGFQLEQNQINYLLQKGFIRI